MLEDMDILGVDDNGEVEDQAEFPSINVDEGTDLQSLALEFEKGELLTMDDVRAWKDSDRIFPIELLKEACLHLLLRAIGLMIEPLQNIAINNLKAIELCDKSFMINELEKLEKLIKGFESISHVRSDVEGGQDKDRLCKKYGFIDRNSLAKYLACLRADRVPDWDDGSVDDENFDPEYEKDEVIDAIAGISNDILVSRLKDVEINGNKMICANYTTDQEPEINRFMYLNPEDIDLSLVWMRPFKMIGLGPKKSSPQVVQDWLRSHNGLKVVVKYHNTGAGLLKRRIGLGEWTVRIEKFRKMWPMWNKSTEVNTASLLAALKDCPREEINWINTQLTEIRDEAHIMDQTIKGLSIGKRDMWRKENDKFVLSNTRKRVKVDGQWGYADRLIPVDDHMAMTVVIQEWMKDRIEQCVFIGGEYKGVLASPIVGLPDNGLEFTVSGDVPVKQDGNLSKTILFTPITVKKL